MSPGQMAVSLTPLDFAISHAAFSALSFPSAYHSCRFIRTIQLGFTINLFAYRYETITIYTFLFKHTASSLQHLWSMRREASSLELSRQMQVKRDEVRTQCLTVGESPQALTTFLLVFTSMSAIAFCRLRFG